MSRVAVDPNPEQPASLTVVALLGLAPLALMGARFDLALAYGLVALVVVPLTAALQHFLHDLVDERWLPAWGVLAAAFLVSLAELGLRLFDAPLLDNLGLYLPALAVSPLVLFQTRLVGRHEGLAGMFGESLRMAGVFFCLLAATAAVRELVGNGTLTLFVRNGRAEGLSVPGLSANPVALVSGAAGGLLLLGFVLAFRNWLALRSSQAAELEAGKGADR